MREEKLGPVNTSGMTGISVVIEPSTAEKLIEYETGRYYPERWFAAVREDAERRRRRRLLRWILKKIALTLAFVVLVLLLAWAAIAIRPSAAHAVTVTDLYAGVEYEDPRVGCVDDRVDYLGNYWTGEVWSCGPPRELTDPPCVVVVDWTEHSGETLALACVDVDAEPAYSVSEWTVVEAPEPGTILGLVIAIAVAAAVGCRKDYDVDEVRYTSKDGKPRIYRVVRDVDGHVVKREIVSAEERRD